MGEEELCREIKSGAFSMQVADCERNIRIQFEQLQQENQELKERIDKAIEYIRIYRSYQKIDNKDYLKGRDEIGCLDIYQVDELLDILKEVE